MSVSTTAHPERRSGSNMKLILGLLLLVAAGIALAWFGAGSLRGETTASGLRFRTVEEGTGPLIKNIDGVMVEYEGRLPDGTVFENTEGRGAVPMIPAQMIPGFSEALTKMQQGGRYRIRIPSKLAYGSSPPPGSPIPANADLEFDVHVVQVVPNAGLMQGMQQGGGQPEPQPQPQPQPQPEPQPQP